MYHWTVNLTFYFGSPWYSRHGWLGVKYQVTPALLLPLRTLGVVAVMILAVLLFMCYCALSTWSHTTDPKAFFYLCAFCAHEGETVHTLTRKNWKKVFHPASSRSRTLAAPLEDSAAHLQSNSNLVNLVTMHRAFPIVPPTPHEKHCHLSLVSPCQLGYIIKMHRRSFGRTWKSATRGQIP